MDTPATTADATLTGHPTASERLQLLERYVPASPRPRTATQEPDFRYRDYDFRASFPPAIRSRLLTQLSELKFDANTLEPDDFIDCFMRVRTLYPGSREERGTFLHFIDRFFPEIFRAFSPDDETAWLIAGRYRILAYGLGDEYDLSYLKPGEVVIVDAACGSHAFRRYPGSREVYVETAGPLVLPDDTHEPEAEDSPPHEYRCTHWPDVGNIRIGRKFFTIADTTSVHYFEPTMIRVIQPYI